MPIFVWSNNYSVGVPTIDAQHRKLVDLINELHDAMKAGKGQDILGNVLSQLVSYTLSHFSAEERLMQQAGYPAYLAHKAEHDRLTEHVGNLQREFQIGNVALSLETLSFLKDWLQHHILATDKRYSSTFQSRGIP